MAVRVFVLIVSVVVSAVLPVVALVTPSVVMVVDMAPPLGISPAAFAVTPC
ncbi:hypothetical protein [Ornithinimicrobium sediminis]|uniref:hypothetical protein n=1 Tax=Ornithinimicrobium sediminis TaxID=2904603 RepID=UPI001E6567BD|nr:hypothetical protein [Ornithinimicrobium sediminis]MCE0485975.1 hypothetical protein [Ornithinimicrobium sediminis]